MEVVGNQEFVQLGADQVARLLASEDLNVPSEEHIFNVSYFVFSLVRLCN